jgi:glycosyltransferase involved in cell wall biosynthesis
MTKGEGRGEMDITVILCTYNRCKHLPAALNSVAASMLPQSVEWEILVVDNNSTDQTREIATQFCKQDPRRFRYLFEAQPGLSSARNAGIRQARGRILAFVDDDVIVGPSWLRNLTAALHGGEWAGVGGRVIPKWTCPPPRWLSPDSHHAAGPLVAFHPSPEAGQLNEAPIGANMAFQKTMFEKYGGFRTDLGRRPGSLMSNEDTEFADRLISAGERLRYEPSAVVYHPVLQDRIQRKYFESWWLNKGRSSFRQFGVASGTTYFVAGIPLYLLRRFAKWMLKWIVALDPADRFSNKLNAWENLGEIVECYRESNVAKKRPEKCSA